MIEEIFNDCHGALPMADLITLEDIYYSSSRIINKLGLPEDCTEILDYLEVDPSDIYYNNESMFSRFFYLKGFVMVEIPNFEMQYLKMFHVKERIHQLTNRISKLIEEDKWSEAFFYSDKRLLIPKFVEVYKSIPKDQVVDVFTEIWVRSESGFELITNEILSYVYSFKELSDEYKERRKRLLEKANGNRYLTVYHGSTEVGDDISWSLSRDVAQWFANRFGNEGSVAKGEVAIENVIDYLDRRSEDEVLIFPKDVKICEDTI